MKKLIYSVAMSLDGYIAGPEDEFDWILMDPAIDFAAIFDQFDTFVMGRRTFEVTQQSGGPGMKGARVYVFSTTLRQEDYPRVVVSADPVGTVSELREGTGKDIWLFGGGVLFETLLEAGLVDGVDVAVVPVLLGGGVPMLHALGHTAALELHDSHVYPSGIVTLRYRIERG
jgi:dihydrofolate reductase